MAFPHLDRATPFEDLVTDVLAEDQIHHAVFGAFQRYSALPSAITGTATAGSTGQTLVASGSTFVTSGVVVGDVIYNSTDGSYAVVKAVTSETQLSTTPLKWGTNNVWASTNTFSIRTVPYRIIALTAADGTNPPGFYVRNSGNSAWTVLSASEVDKIQKQGYVYNDTTGSANAYAVSVTPAPTAYAAGQRFSVKANFTNTGAATLNVNGLGAKAINKLGDSTALAAGDILSGQVFEVTYDGTDFQMVSPIATAPAVGATVSTFTAGEAIAAGDAVYVATADGKAYRTDTTSQAKCVFVGFAKSAAASSATVTVETDGKSTANFSGLTTGSAYFLNNSKSAVFNGAQQLDEDTTVDGYRMSSSAVNLANTECLASFTTHSGGTLTLSSIDFRVAYNTYTTGNLSFYYAQYYATLYADNAGQPGTQLVQGTTGKFDGSSADALKTVTASYVLQPGTKYWLGISAVCGWNYGQSAQIRIKNSNVTSNCSYGTRTSGVFTADNTKDLYYALSFTTSSSSSGNYAKNVTLTALGNVGTSPVTSYSVPVGRAVSATEMLIDRTESRDVTVATPSVGASPYTYQNVGDRPVNFSVTGGTVSLIQFSRDNTNFYQISTLTNAMVALAPGDYCKVTYTMAPTAKVFPL